MDENGGLIVPINNDRQLISEVAMDIGKEVVAHIEIMYPAVFAQLPGSGKLSIRNSIHNEIMAALDTIDANEIRARLERRKSFRRRHTAFYRNIRKDAGTSGAQQRENPRPDKPDAEAEQERIEYRPIGFAHQ